MKERAKQLFLGVGAALLLAAAAFVWLYFTRIQSIASIRRITDYADGYNLYCMDVKYDYDLEAVIAYGITDDQSTVDAILQEALPLLPVSIEVPDFGCSAFCISDRNGDVLMGRNYDFRNDTSAMLVHCNPKGGYRSVAFAALDNVGANTPDTSLKAKLTALTAPFICLDGMNEKGVSIAVLTLDSEPTAQNTGRPVIATTLAIRLVLDHAATTKEAVALLSNYDMFASAGRDYHFYITDAAGDGRVVEYDCNSENRELVATPIRTVTNFYALYMDQVLPGQRNGIYGHGRERYDRIEAIFIQNTGAYSRETAWQALQAAQQLPDPEDVTSNTQWSILYDDTNLTADVVLRRNWSDAIHYELSGNRIEKVAESGK